MVCPGPEQRAWPSGVGARDRRQCPCKQAKTRCISASGERINEGDCEDLWRTCKERKKQKSDMVKAAWGDALTMEFGMEFASGFGLDSTMEFASGKLVGMAVFGKDTGPVGNGMCPCGKAKKECMTPAGVKVLEGECAEKWQACAEKKRQKFLSPDSDTKDGPCTEAKKKCWDQDGSKSFEGVCKQLWMLCGNQIAHNAKAIAAEAALAKLEWDSDVAGQEEQDEDPFAPYVRQMQGLP